MTGKRRLQTAVFEAISVVTLENAMRTMLNSRMGREFNRASEWAISFVSPDFYKINKTIQI